MGISNSACNLSFAVSPSSFFSSLSSATTAATTLPPELLTKFIEFLKAVPAVKTSSTINTLLSRTEPIRIPPSP